MLSGFHIQYTMDTLPSFPDGTSCIQFQHEDVVVSAPLKTVDEVKIFEGMLEDSALRNQVVSETLITNVVINFKFSQHLFY